MLADDIINGCKNNENGNRIQQKCKPRHFFPGSRFRNRFGIGSFEIRKGGYQEAAKESTTKN